MTHKVFDELGLGDKAISLGCPSHFLCKNKALGLHIKSKALKLEENTLLNGIAITAGNPAIANLTKLE